MHIFFTIKVNFFTLIVASSLALLIGYAIGYYLRKMFTEYQIKEAEELGRKIVQEAEKEAENRVKGAAIEIREEKVAAKAALEKELRDKQNEVRKQEQQARQKEEDLNRTIDKYRNMEQTLDGRSKELVKKEEVLNRDKEKCQKMVDEQVRKLETIASYTVDQAKEEIKSLMLEEARLEAGKEIRKLEERTRMQADEEARKIITSAVQRLASDHVAETTVSVVELPNDEIKGRIIGREGRNIRALEQCTGVDLIIDDTPGAVVLSAFDPIRREVARRALEKLCADGRIHPGRIEEVVGKCKKEINVQIRVSGEQAALDLGIDGIHPEIIKLLGRLRYRTSYTQNVLDHVKEVAWLCGMMAGELGLDIKLARRAGLLHDIGKAIDHQTDGTHTQLGVEVAKRHNEHKFVINAIAAHHEDVECESLYAVLVTAADTISASRPGARREMLETYVKRMGQLEEIGDSFKGVEKTYAIQAGREIRIMVVPDGVNDENAGMLAKDIARRIEKEVTYPGEIKITVIRENRFVEYAR